MSLISSRNFVILFLFVRVIVPHYRSKILVLCNQIEIRFVEHRRNSTIMEAAKSKPETKKRVTFSDDAEPKRPDYQDLATRISTFEQRCWPPSIPHKPKHLAEAGFYYTGIFLKIAVGELCFCVNDHI